MKKMKRFFAVLLAMAMVLGMSVTAFAENKKPTSNDKGSITVTNVKEANATVRGYKIVKADYNSLGFAGYSKVDETDTFDIYEPTATEITALAKKYNSKTADFTIQTGTAVTSDAKTVYTYTQSELTVGTYLILITGTGDTIYNPMVVSIDYKTQVEDSNANGNSNEAGNGTVNAGSKWDKWGVEDAVVYAKSSEVSIEKTVNDKTADRGESVEFTVNTIIPDYSTEYENVQFDITDTLSNNLKLLVDSTHPFKVEVSDDGETYKALTIGEKTYSLTAELNGKTTYTLSFQSGWIMDNGGKYVKITYSAKLDKAAEGDTETVNATPYQNDVVLTYTHDPHSTSGGTKTTTDTEYVYTFDIDGSITGSILKKVQPGTTANKVVALKDAQFTLYTDAECTQKYTNATHLVDKATATSDDNGKLFIDGLAADTYYLKETEAPKGFSLNDIVYQIVITPEFNKDENNKETTLKSWTIAVGEVAIVDGAVSKVDGVVQLVSGTTKTNTFTVSSKKEGNVVKWDATPDGTQTTTDIMNTKISSLPSTGGIGTTIFTIGGCAIMIIAAGLFFATRRKSAK